MNLLLGRELIRIIKATALPCGPLLSLPVGNPIEAILRPVATKHGSLNSHDVRVLTEWRNRFVQSFLTEFEANESRTERWLTDLVGPDDTRILFMIDDAQSRTVGYMGLAFIDWINGTGEADAVVRGGDAPRGLMSKALGTMLGWAKRQLGLSQLGVRVRSDNPAVEFYRKFGFCEVQRIPLRRVEQENVIQWVEDPMLQIAEPSLVHMVLPDSNEDQ